MEKNALIAIVLSIAILILYQEWVGRYYETPKGDQPAQQATSPTRPLPKPVEEVPMVTPTTPLQQTQQTQKTLQKQQAQLPVKEFRVETDRYIAVFTSRGARLKSLLLKWFRDSVEKESPPFEMVSASRGVPYPLGLQFQEPVPFNDETIVYEGQGGDLKLSGDTNGTLTFRGQTPWGATLIKKFTFTGSLYTIGLEVSTGGAGARASPGLLLTTRENYETVTRDAVFEGLVAMVGGKLIRESGDELKEGKEINGQIDWAGFGYTYFLFAMLPDDADQGNLSVKQAGPGLQMILATQTPRGSMPRVGYTLFIGPKDVDALKAMDRGLERSIDFGWFTIVAAPLLQVLRFSHRFTGSYGLDIILMTILIKLILAPLTHKSFVSMKSMQKLQPQMQRIKDRHKDDKEKMNREIMDLYKRNKVNPLGGCLPMLLQFPVFIGLYNALRTPIELRHASFLWIKDLSRPDFESLPFTLLGWNVGFPILVLLMGASMFIQQWMTPAVGDPNQRRMMMMMPLVFTVLFVTFPAGLTIYWLVNNVLTIGQQYLINRMTK
jgi:YidC/Oxa1 family membrane protein insertase